MSANNDPIAYYGFLNFSDLIENAVWAGWVYDNPGVDTDNDGYAGEFSLCVLDSELVDSTDSIWQPSVVDTFYYEGDGVPDWRGAALSNWFHRNSAKRLRPWDGVCRSFPQILSARAGWS